ncbi:MAG: helix-turn-helix domain-containing protein [Bacteroidales bacterium]
MIGRLLELMRIKNMTSSQLADTIGVQRSGISHFVSGRNKPSLEFILKILKEFPDVNPDWMLFGNEPVFRNDLAVKPIFSDDLFSESVKQSEKPEKKTEKKAVLIPGGSPAPVFVPGMESENKRKDTENKEKKFPEKYVVFYNDRTFREYFSE